MDNARYLRSCLAAAALAVSILAPAPAGAQPQVPPLQPAPSPSPTPAPPFEQTTQPQPTPAPLPTPTTKVKATQPPATAQELAVRATSGLGMYVWRWDRTGTVDAVVAHARSSGISHLVVRASSTTQGFYLAPILSELLPKAHAAGIKVVAYDPPRFEDVEADVRRAQELIAFRANGQGIDAFAADIEPKWDLLTEANADRYGTRLREVAGPRFPLVGIVYPPNLVGARFPFAAVARHFDVLSPMSYQRARTTDGPGFTAASVEELRPYGKPVSVIGQAFAYTGQRNPGLRAHPTRPELEASIAAARAQGAVGMSFWVWETAEPWVFDSIREAEWPPVVGEGAGVKPPPSPASHRAPAAPAQPAATPSPSSDAALRDQAAGLPAVPASLPSRPRAVGMLAALLALAATTLTMLRARVPAYVRAAPGFARAFPGVIADAPASLRRLREDLHRAPAGLLLAAERATAPLVALRPEPARPRSRAATGRSRPGSSPSARAGRSSRQADPGSRPSRAATGSRRTRAAPAPRALGSRGPTGR